VITKSYHSPSITIDIHEGVIVKEVQKFMEDQLRKGYIKPLKSPQMLPVFFVGKKDKSKRMVMDYGNLNNQTVKNNYPLPLITDLINNMGSKKVFTKMDLR